MHTNENKVSVQVISDKNDILQMEREWNDLVSDSCKNPFMLSRFVTEFSEYHPKDWAPLVLVISLNQTIIGIAPFVTRKQFGIQAVRASNPSWCSEFIINNQHRETCITKILESLFKTLNCKYAEFTLPCDSLNFEPILNQCNVHRIHVKTSPKMGRLLIPINCTWDEFISAQGTKYRAKIRRIERSLTQEGSWKTDYVDANRQSDAIKKIFEVEQNSWKDKWRTERGESTDESLMTVLSASQMLSNEPKFKLSICSLELDSKTIAYCTAIEYDDVAFIVKTSYDEHYKKLYSGIFIQHTTIQELFKNGRIKQIDFLSDLQYLRTWANDCIPRTRIMLAKGLLPTAMQSISETALIGKIRRKLF